ncbi:hypothetical protein Tco_1183437 [Tanacetum coccineum]
MQEPSESETRKTVPPPHHDPKDKGKAKMIELEKPLKKKDQIKFDEEMAKRHAEELQFDSWTKGRSTLQSLELKRSEENHQPKLKRGIKYLFVPMDSEGVKGSKSQAEGSKKRTRKELNEETVKRQKLEDDAEKAELKACLKIVLDDDSAVNVESLATKYPIVDWMTHILAEDKIQDVLDLYRLVKERFETTSPEGYDRLLWGDLITLFEPSEEDEIWKAQQDYTLISWSFSDLSSHSTRSEEMFEYILLMKIKLLIKKLEDLEVMIVTTAGYVSTAGEVQRKYSKSLLLLVLVITARRVSAVRV